MRYMVAAAMLFGVLGGAAPLNADQPITVSVYPAVAVARGTAQLKILVERNEQNRTLTWEVDGPTYFRSSTAQLNGLDSPRSWFFFVKDLPAGEYAVRATVTRNNSSQSVDQTSITVVPGLQP